MYGIADAHVRNICISKKRINLFLNETSIKNVKNIRIYI